MLLFHPQSSLTWKFDVVQAREGSEDRRAVVQLSFGCSDGIIRTEKKTIAVGCPGLFSKTYEATLNGKNILAAERISWWHRGYIMKIGSQKWRLAPVSSLGREFHLSLNGETVGRIRPDSPLRRSGNADFPEKLPFDMQLFCLWLVLEAWKRAMVASSV